MYVMWMYISAAGYPCLACSAFYEDPLALSPCQLTNGQVHFLMDLFIGSVSLIRSSSVS